MRRRSGVIRNAVAVLAALAALGCPVAAAGAAEPAADSPQSAAGSTIYGIHEPNSWRRPTGAPTKEQIGDWLQGLGAEAHRWTIPWNSVERNAPVPLLDIHRYDFSDWDEMYTVDLDHGIRPLIVVINSPSWAQPSGVPSDFGRGIPPAPDHLDDWAAFCAEVARRYPQAVGIEVWNEPNNVDFWGRGLANIKPDPAYYTQMLATAYDAIKGVDPSMPVIGGALANAQRSLSNGQISARSFLTSMLQDGAASHMDGVSEHDYPISPSSRLDHTLFEPTIDQIRAALAGAGVQLPIWLTEVGVTTTPGTALTVPEDQQAGVLADFFAWIPTQEDVNAFFIHTLTEPSQDNGDSQKGYALLDGDSTSGFTEKPAYSALARAASGGIPPLAAPPGGGPAPTPPRVMTPLRLRVRAPRKKAIAGGRGVVVRARCSRDCIAVAKGILRISARSTEARFRLRTARASVHAGRFARIAMPLHRASALRLLSRASTGTVRVRVRVRVTATAGASRTSKRIGFRVRARAAR